MSLDQGVYIKLDTASVNQFINNLEKKKQAVQQAADQSVQRVADFVFELAQENVPVESGALRRSGTVTNTSKGNTIRYTISYGDNTLNDDGIPTAQYAVIRHERYSKNNAGYKWLERAVRDTGLSLFLDELSGDLTEALTTK